MKIFQTILCFDKFIINHRLKLGSISGKDVVLRLPYFTMAQNRGCKPTVDVVLEHPSYSQSSGGKAYEVTLGKNQKNFFSWTFFY